MTEEIKETVCSTLDPEGINHCKGKPVYRITIKYGKAETDKEEIICCEECEKKHKDIAKKFSYGYLAEIIDPTFHPSPKRKYTKRKIEPLTEEELQEQLEFEDELQNLISIYCKFR